MANHFSFLQELELVFYELTGSTRGLGRDTDLYGRVIYTYNGLKIGRAEYLLRDSNVSKGGKQILGKNRWERYILPIIPLLSLIPGLDSSFRRKSLDREGLEKSPSYLTHFAGLDLFPNKHAVFKKPGLKQLMIVLSVMAYLFQAITRSITVPLSLLLEFPPSLAALACKHFFKFYFGVILWRTKNWFTKRIKGKEGLALFINPFFYLALPILCLPLLRLLCNLVLMAARAITSINSGPEKAYHDMLSYCEEWRINDDYGLPKPPSTFAKFLATSARIATFATMIAAWVALFTHVPLLLVPLMTHSAILATLISSLIAISKFFVADISLTSIIMGCVGVGGFALAYKFLCSSWKQLTNAYINTYSDNHDPVRNIFLRAAANSFVGCLAILGLNPQCIATARPNKERIDETKVNNLLHTTRLSRFFPKSAGDIGEEQFKQRAARFTTPNNF